jgi:hypothetical protein
MSQSPPYAAIIAAGFDIKGLKTWSSRNGYGYQYTLTHNGKAVATVTNDGNGGITRIEWAAMARDGSLDVGWNPSAAQIKKATAQHTLSTAAKAVFDSFVTALPTYQADGLSYKLDAEWFAEELVNIAETRKSLRNKTLFRVDGTEYQIKAVYDAKIAAYIKGKYPTATILNEDPAYAVAM